MYINPAEVAVYLVFGFGMLIFAGIVLGLILSQFLSKGRVFFYVAVPFIFYTLYYDLAGLYYRLHNCNYDLICAIRATQFTLYILWPFIPYVLIAIGIFISFGLRKLFKRPVSKRR